MLYTIEHVNASIFETDFLVAKVLLSNPEIQCNRQTMTIACFTGDYELIKWLIDNRDEFKYKSEKYVGVSFMAMRAVVGKGLLEIVKLLYDNFPEFNDPKYEKYILESEMQSIIYQGLFDGHINVIEYLMTYWTDRNLFMKGMKFFNIRVYEWLTKNVSFYNPSLADFDDTFYIEYLIYISKTALNGPMKFKLFKWVYTSKYEYIRGEKIMTNKQEIIKNLLMSGKKSSLETLLWLKENAIEFEDIDDNLLTFTENELEYIVEEYKKSLSKISLHLL